MRCLSAPAPDDFSPPDLRAVIEGQRRRRSMPADLWPTLGPGVASSGSYVNWPPSSSRSVVERPLKAADLPVNPRQPSGRDRPTAVVGAVRPERQRRATNSIPDRQHHQSGILNAIAESRLGGVAMIHFEGRHAPPPPTRARGADGSVGGAVQVEAVEQVVGVSVALPQRHQAVTGLDHLQDRGGVVERVIHEAAPGER